MTSEDRFTIFLRGLAGLVLVGIAIAYAGRRDWPPACIFSGLGLFWLWLTYRTYQKRQQQPVQGNEPVDRHR
jgi:uncharacterized membrane protein